MQWPFKSDPLLLDLARQELPGRRQILVTGATGFVGSRLAQVMHDAGHEVTITGRSPWRVCSSGRFVAADITRSTEVRDLVRNQEIVIHCAAATKPWGTYDYHRAINVCGTQNIVDACVEHRVQRLVHVSSRRSSFSFVTAWLTILLPCPENSAMPMHGPKPKPKLSFVMRWLMA